MTQPLVFGFDFGIPVPLLEASLFARREWEMSRDIVFSNSVSAEERMSHQCGARLLPMTIAAAPAPYLIMADTQMRARF